MPNRTILSNQNNKMYQNNTMQNMSPNQFDNAIIASQKPQKSKKPLIIGAIILLIIGLSFGIYFFLSKEKIFRPSEDIEEGDSLTPVEVLYIDEGEDEETGLQSFVEEKITETKNEGDETESFRYKMMLLNIKTSDGEYDAVLSELNSYNPETLSYEEQFMLYNTFSRVYEALDDTEKYNEYYNLALNAHENYASTVEVEE